MSRRLIQYFLLILLSASQLSCSLMMQRAPSEASRAVASTHSLTDCLSLFSPFITPQKSTGKQVVNTANTLLSRKDYLRLRQNIKTVFETRNAEEISDVENLFMNKIQANHLKKTPQQIRELKGNTKVQQERILEGVEYMFYVDQFGTQGNLKMGDFQSVSGMLDHLEKLGIDTLYPLPFLDSPMKDSGFDISNFYRVNSQMGGDSAFTLFLREAKKRKMNVKMDLILNHVSEEHVWFQKLLAGDLSYKDYFVVLDHEPIILDRFTDSRGPIVKYLEKDKNGHDIEIERRLIFPDIASSHYRKITVPLKNGQSKNLWVYHTFFPFQLDLNYKNKNVLAEAMDIISYWADKGINVFRLDAIPFLDKTAENHQRTHSIIEILSLFLKEISPASLFMVEANQRPADMVKYLGRDTKLKNHFLDKVVKGTTEASMGYNFGEIPYWASLLTGENIFIKKVQKSMQGIEAPTNSGWTNFLRVHDELTLEMVDEQTRQTINKELLHSSTEKGVPFREGFGVAGRMASFLDKNPDRINLAYSLLLGRPGKPVIYYGDEIAAPNNIEYMVQEAISRKSFMENNKIPIKNAEGEMRDFLENKDLPIDIPVDARDANRGPIDKNLFYQAHDENDPSLASTVFHNLKKMIAAREKHIAIRRGDQQILPTTSKNSYVYLMQHKKERVLVCNNLSSTMQKIEIKKPVSLQSLPDRGEFIDAITGTSMSYSVVKNRIVIELAPYQTIWGVIP